MTYLAVYGIPVAFAVMGWLILRDIDHWLDTHEYKDPFTRQRDEIRGLPERPDLFDQDAA